MSRFSGTLFQVRNHFRFRSGGLRYAATTGYYLTAFQAEAIALAKYQEDANLFEVRII